MRKKANHEKVRPGDIVETVEKFISVYDKGGRLPGGKFTVADVCMFTNQSPAAVENVLEYLARKCTLAKSGFTIDMQLQYTFQWAQDMLHEEEIKDLDVAVTAAIEAPKSGQWFGAADRDKISCAKGRPILAVYKERGTMRLNTAAAKLYDVTKGSDRVMLGLDNGEIIIRIADKPSEGIRMSLQGASGEKQPAYAFTCPKMVEAIVESGLVIPCYIPVEFKDGEWRGLLSTAKEA